MMNYPEAVCLFLNLKPSEENMQMANDYFKDKEMDVCHLYGYDHYVPVAVLKRHMKINPYKYVAYPKEGEKSNSSDEKVYDQKEEGGQQTTIADKKK